MSEKLLLNDYIFGDADAETEFRNKKEIFEKAFYDPKNIVDKLINGYQFMLIGRKGVGKTAFSAKIRSIADKDNSIQCNMMDLSQFEFGVFNKLRLPDLDGTHKYKNSWKLILLIYIYKMFSNDYTFLEVESFYERAEFLEASEILKSKNINSIIRKLSKKSFNFDIKFFKYTSESEYEDGKLSYSEVYDYLLEGLEGIYTENKFLLIIDGLDDMLRFKKERLLMISGLIRGINELNRDLSDINATVKIIFLAREDILASVTDPDLNKIRRDAGITLNWNSKDDDLKNMVNLRFKLSGISEENLEKHWNLIFPPKIKGKDSWDYVTEFTLSKPRDILQFLSQCQRNYPTKSYLKYSELDRVLIDYSTEYFIEEMKNELVGFIDDDVIHLIPQVLQTIGGSDFRYIDFKKNMERVYGNQNDIYYKRILLTLFENGYVGQVTEMKYWDKEIKKNVTRNQVLFKHKKPTVRINYDCKFSIHKGLYKALNIIKK
mgnify:CR=1 FL=1